jgi:hypothetical protein
MIAELEVPTGRTGRKSKHSIDLEALEAGQCWVSKSQSEVNAARSMAVRLKKTKGIVFTTTELKDVQKEKIGLPLDQQAWATWRLA